MSEMAHRIQSNYATHGVEFAVKAEQKRLIAAGFSKRVAGIMACHKVKDVIFPKFAA